MNEPSRAPLVIPSQIPWDRLRGKDLEECVYWLISSMGAKDLVWRLGGGGEGASDQGRDLECVFHILGPDGEPQPQRWWIEVKGRATTLERDAVERAVNHAIGSVAVDALVVVTNTQFSNPTRDWVKEAQKKHRILKVLLWDRAALERLVAQHPDVVFRFFSEALSTEGKLEVARTRFWNQLNFVDRPNLRLFWKNRARLPWDTQSTLAVMVGEAANGNFSHRPWALLFGPSDILVTLGDALLNFLPFCLRADAAGVEQKPYIKAVAYLTLSALHQTSGAKVSELFRTVWKTEADPGRSCRSAQDMAIDVVLRQLKYEIHDVCLRGCDRVYDDAIELPEEQVESYWERLRWPAVDEEEQPPRDRIVVEKHSAPCRAGFPLNEVCHCPLVRVDSEATLEQELAVIEQVIRSRGGGAGSA